MLDLIKNFIINIDINWRGKVFKPSGNNGNDPLKKSTKHVYPLSTIINSSLRAETITYSFNYKQKKNILDITVKIDGIKNNINKYELFLIDLPHNIINPTIKISNIDVHPTITSNGAFSVLNFNFTNFKTKGENILINWRCIIKNKKHRANLYFLPKNYLKQVNTIKIEYKQKAVLMFQCYGNNRFGNPVSLNSKGHYIVLDAQQNPNYIDSAFFIRNYKEFYNKDSNSLNKQN